MREFKLSNPLLSKDQYEEMYAESYKDKEQFWSKIAKSQLSWLKISLKLKILITMGMCLSSGLRMEK